MELILLCASGIVGGCGLLVLRRAAGRGIAPLPPASDRGRGGAVVQHRGPAAVIADTIHGTSLRDRDVHLRLLGRSRADDDRDLIVHMALLAALAMVVTGGIATAVVGVVQPGPSQFQQVSLGHSVVWSCSDVAALRRRNANVQRFVTNCRRSST